MGWDFTQGATRADIIEECLSDAGNYRPVAHKAVGNRLWAVFERKPDAPTHTEYTRGDGSTYLYENPTRFIGLFLLRQERGYGWGYKPMEEGMGPCFYDCPLEYLAMTPPPDSPHSNGWRDRVRSWHMDQQFRTQFIATLRLGQRIHLTGRRPSDFEVVQLKPLLGRADNGRVYRIPKTAVTAAFA